MDPHRLRPLVEHSSPDPLAWLTGVAVRAGIPAPERAALDGVRTLPERWALVARTGGITPEALARLVAAHYRLDVANLGPANPRALRLVPASVAWTHQVLAVGESDRNVFLATADPTSTAAEEAVEIASGRRPVFRIAPPAAVRRAIAACYPEPATAAEAPVAVAAPLGASAPILVVDDDDVVRALLRSLLETEGFAVHEAGDGHEALGRLAEQAFGLVITDLRMPVLDGRGLVRRVRAVPPPPGTRPVPIIVVTSSEDEAEELTLMDLGADDYVRKPFEPARLRARVRAVLRRSGA